MKHIGKSVHRLNGNPRERIFAESWEKENERYTGKPHSTLAWLLHCTSSNMVWDEPSTDECVVAATVIQWLGSPVGFSWLTETLDRAGYVLKEKEDA